MLYLWEDSFTGTLDEAGTFKNNINEEKSRYLFPKVDIIARKVGQVIGEETIGIVSYLRFLSDLERIWPIYILAAFTVVIHFGLCQTVSNREQTFQRIQIWKRNLIGFWLFRRLRILVYNAILPF